VIVAGLIDLHDGQCWIGGEYETADTRVPPEAVTNSQQFKAEKISNELIVCNGGRFKLITVILKVLMYQDTPCVGLTLYRMAMPIGTVISKIFFT